MPLGSPFSASTLTSFSMVPSTICHCLVVSSTVYKPGRSPRAITIRIVTENLDFLNLTLDDLSRRS
jgi:hypothetical protein